MAQTPVNPCSQSIAVSDNASYQIKTTNSKIIPTEIIPIDRYFRRRLRGSFAILAASVRIFELFCNNRSCCSKKFLDLIVSTYLIRKSGLNCLRQEFLSVPRQELHQAVC